MEEKKTSIFKLALVPGIILGVVLIIISLISYIFDLVTMGIYAGLVISLASFVIRIIVLVIYSKKYRDEILGGFIKYGKALVFCIIMGIYASVVISAYSFAFNTVIDPDYTKNVTEKVQNMTVENLYEKGLPDEMIEATIEKMESKEFPSPVKTSLLTIPIGIFYTLLAGLLSSIFVKKNEDPYQNAMQDIDEE